MVVNTNMCEDRQLDYVKYAQGTWLLKCLSEFVDEHALVDVPTVMCGDLKSPADSSVVHRILNKSYPLIQATGKVNTRFVGDTYASDESIAIFKQVQNDVKSLEKALENVNGRFRSAYGFSHPESASAEHPKNEE